MRCIIKGEIIGSGKNKSKTGKDYVYTDLLSGREKVRVFGIETNQERLTPIEITVDIFVGRDGKLVINPVKKA